MPKKITKKQKNWWINNFCWLRKWCNERMRTTRITQAFQIYISYQTAITTVPESGFVAHRKGCWRGAELHFARQGQLFERACQTSPILAGAMRIYISGHACREHVTYTMDFLNLHAACITKGDVVCVLIASGYTRSLTPSDSTPAVSLIARTHIMSVYFLAHIIQSQNKRHAKISLFGWEFLDD